MEEYFSHKIEFYDEWIGQKGPLSPYGISLFGEEKLPNHNYAILIFAYQYPLVVLEEKHWTIVLVLWSKLRKATSLSEEIEKKN